MLEKLKYINHMNETIVFGEDGILVSSNDFRDFVWSYDSQFMKITSFTKKIVKKTLPFVIYGGVKKANKVFEILEKDVLARKPGKLYVGDYYIKGYFTESAKEKYLNGIIKGSLTFVTDQGSWIKSANYTYHLNDITLQGGLGYSYDYPFDYTPSVNVQNINNNSFVPCNFIMTFYGPAINPSLVIAGHTYQVNTEIGNNEYLVVDSYEKTIYKTASDGQRINEFSKRDLEHYVFEKIPTGANKIIPNQDMNYDIVLLQERSEPEWI